MLSSRGAKRGAALLLASLMLIGSAGGVTGVTLQPTVTPRQGSDVTGVSTTVIIVDGDADGDDEFATISGAINDAVDGDRIEVRPGVYRESLSLGKNVTLIAPDGATLNGSGLTGSFGKVNGIEIEGMAAPVIDGFRIVDYRDGVEVESGTDWVLRNSTIVNSTRAGVDAAGTDANWTVANTTIIDAGSPGSFIGPGIYADGSSGDWTVKNVEIRNVSDPDEPGIDAAGSSGNWTLRNVTITRSDEGVEAFDTTGDWAIQETTIVNGSGRGVDAFNSSGAWRVDDSTLVDIGSVGIYANNADGDWTIANTTVVDTESSSVAAFGTDGNWTIAGSILRDPRGNGVYAQSASGAWTVRNTTVSETGFPGVYAGYSSADWTVQDTRILNGSSDGVFAQGTSGDWVVTNTTIAGNSGDGVTAFGADGNWTVANSTITGSSSNGIDAQGTTGNWTVRKTRIANGSFDGIDARSSTGAWEITGSSIVDNARDGVNAFDATGRWSVTESRIADNGRTGLVARQTATGSATRVWWGAVSGPNGSYTGAGDSVAGNVSVNPIYTDAALTTTGTAAARTRSAPTTLVVDDDGPADTRTIQAALDQAQPDDTVEVRPGTYTQTIRVDLNVTVIAPDGANLIGRERASSQPDLIQIPVGSTVAPRIDGFSLSNAADGIEASYTAGDWIISNLTISNSSNVGVLAFRSSGAWSVRDTTITDSALNGIGAFESSGDWTVRNVTITESSRHGIAAFRSSGDWSVRSTTILDTAAAGIQATESSGSWTVQDTVIANATTGVDAPDSTGDWTLQGVSIGNTSGADGSGTTAGAVVASTEESIATGAEDEDRNSDTQRASASDPARDRAQQGVRTAETTATDDAGVGVGVYAVSTDGAWEIHESSITDATDSGLNATDAAPAGDARAVYWGASDGPSGQFNGSGVAVLGNVTVQPYYTAPNLTTLSVPTVRVGTGSGTVSESVAVPVTLTDAPAGLSGFALTVSIANGSVATVSDVRYPTEFNQSVTNTSIRNAGRTVRLKVADLTDAVQPGATGVRLGTLILRADRPGATTLTVSVRQMDDDVGDPIAPAIQAGEVSVQRLPTVVGEQRPRDLDGDGRFEDINGNGRLDFTDVVALFGNSDAPSVRGRLAFDFNRNGQIDFDDIVTLFESI